MSPQRLWTVVFTFSDESTRETTYSEKPSFPYGAVYHQGDFTGVVSLVKEDAEKYLITVHLNELPKEQEAEVAR
jgi:hypothetical protein